MRGMKKSKRISWASDGNLCQDSLNISQTEKGKGNISVEVATALEIRLFLSDECPLQVGLSAQDHLQAKASWLSHPTGTVSDDILPPGFEGGQTADQGYIQVPDIPVIKWRCPPRVVLDVTWQVVVGEESKEVEIQNQRELRVLEAVYPRPSAIPTDPTFPNDVASFQNNDLQVPLIPITPIEDEDTSDTPSNGMEFQAPGYSQVQLAASGAPPSHCSIPNNQSSQINDKPATGNPLGIEPRVVATALAAINKTDENGGLIDPELLLKILRNPTLIEKLVTDYGPTSNSQNMPAPSASFTRSMSDPSTFPPVSLPDPSHLHMSRAESNTVPIPATSSGSFYSQPVGLGIHPNVRAPPPPVPFPSGPPPIGAPQAKDLNYYKSLIQQHGGERHETSQQFSGRYNHQLGSNREAGNPRSREPNHKIMKPCIYFNSSRGCRNGANCAFQHDASAHSQQRASGVAEVQSAKRMKMDREISS